MTFAERLSELMHREEFTNYKLSKLAGCSATTVANWLSGKEITPTYLQKLAVIFSVTTDYLLGKEKAPVQKDERIISDDDIKFALFGGDGEVTDEMWEEAQFAAQLIKERHRKKKE